MGIDPKLSRKIVKTYELESDFGWFTGVLLQGKKRDNCKNDLAVITVYCPLLNKKNGAWEGGSRSSYLGFSVAKFYEAA